MSTYLELENRVKLLEDILKQAQSELGENHPWCCARAASLMNHDPETNTYEISESGKPCDCWMARAEIILAPPPVAPTGGKCSCTHDSDNHAGKVGLCCAEGCPCMKFKRAP